MSKMDLLEKVTIVIVVVGLGVLMYLDFKLHKGL